MRVRAFALCLVSCSAWFVVAAPGCTNGTTPVCTGDAGCGPSIDDSSLDVDGEGPPEQ